MSKDRKTPPLSDHPRRVLIAPDKFKGTLTSEAAAEAIEKGLRRAWPKVKTTPLVLTDGGEGFMELMVRADGGKDSHCAHDRCGGTALPRRVGRAWKRTHGGGRLDQRVGNCATSSASPKS